MKSPSVFLRDKIGEKNTFLKVFQEGNALFSGFIGKEENAMLIEQENRVRCMLQNGFQPAPFNR